MQRQKTIKSSEKRKTALGRINKDDYTAELSREKNYNITTWVSSSKHNSELAYRRTTWIIASEGRTDERGLDSWGVIWELWGWYAKLSCLMDINGLHIISVLPLAWFIRAGRFDDRGFIVHMKGLGWLDEHKKKHHKFRRCWWKSGMSPWRNLEYTPHETGVKLVSTVENVFMTNCRRYIKSSDNAGRGGPVINLGEISARTYPRTRRSSSWAKSDIDNQS